MLITFPLCISFFTLLITTTLATAPPPPPPYRSIDHILLNCGSSSNTSSPDLLNWEGDTRSKFSPTNFNQVSTPVTADNQESSVPTVPFMTARIIQTPITYSFPVSSGSKFIRLYFYPATYSNFSKETSFFTVKANNFTLLQNFSAFLTVAATANTGYPVFTIIKEFIITVSQNQKLNITLFPEPQNNQNPTHAFINGIEITSMPDHLYYPPNNNMINFINPNGLPYPIKFENNTALENVYRLNVGGRDVSITEDTGMFRKWQQDYEFLYGQSIGLTPYLSNISVQYTKSTPRYIAPEIVYTTYRTMGNQGLNLNFNLTWLLPVDSGFNYLVRLHFCETQLEVTRENQRVFFIFINNQTAETDFDVIHYSGGRGIPVYKDYSVAVPDQGGREGVKRDLWLALYPNKGSKPVSYDAILNGVEIFKMNRPDGSLAGSNPDPVLLVAKPSVPTSLKKSRRSVPVLTIVGVVVSGCLICALCLVVFLIYRRQRRVKDVDGGTTSETKTLWVPFSYNSKSTKSSTTSSLPSDLCHRFSLSELRSATSNFHDDFLIGVGGFGNVYRGCIENGSINVAIKRLNPSSKQGVHEFETEIKMLSKLRHMHLVPLVGYSDDEGEMILVYDYMANGTLRDHLYKTDNPPLLWKKRLEICIGAAKGLYYLHTGAKHTIIHRDVKSTNILLDDKLVAKVSDFGLSKVGPTDVSHTHVSTVVKGSFGYLDPEYYRRQQLTEKSDVYSFGVVLLEVLCARPALIQGISKEQVNLAEWGRICYRKGTLHHIIDKNLTGQIASESLKKFVEIANNCLKDKGTERPNMGDVVWTLEFALQLQETAEQKIKNECGDVGMDGVMSIVSTSTLSSELTSTNDSDMFAPFSEQLSSSHKKSSDTLMTDDRKSDSNLTVGNESVFSEINDPRGR